MKIGVLGSGSVAKTLAAGFNKHGYDVMIGSRDLSKLSEFVSANRNKIRSGSFSETAKFGELIVLAVKGHGAINALQLAGTENIKGKTVIDTSNPISDAPPVNGVIQFFTGPGESIMEQIQNAFPEANLVKSFSCIGSPIMVNPDFGGVKPAMFICGNKEESKQQVKAVLDQFGFETEDMGKAEAARAIEPLCILWCIPGFIQNSWTHAFKLLKK